MALDAADIPFRRSCPLAAGTTGLSRTLAPLRTELPVMPRGCLDKRELHPRLSAGSMAGKASSPRIPRCCIGLRTEIVDTCGRGGQQARPPIIRSGCLFYSLFLVEVAPFVAAVCRLRLLRVRRSSFEF